MQFNYWEERRALALSVPLFLCLEMKEADLEDFTLLTSAIPNTEKLNNIPEKNPVKRAWKRITTMSCSIVPYLKHTEARRPITQKSLHL